MDYRGKKVFVTGADGFIGSHLTEALVRAGADVTALALYHGLDHYGWLDEITADVRSSARLVRGDVRDHAMMQRLIDGQNTVFHLAALIGIPHSYDAPFSYIDVNVTGTANILESARFHGTPRVVHTSTSEVYGTAQTIPITEDHPLVAQSPYSASKIAADKLVESYALSFGLPVVTLRPFNTYGPRQSERAVIPTVIRQALDPNCSEIRVGDTSTVRDFNYIKDSVAAFMTIAAAQSIEYGRAYNAGSGSAVSIDETITMIRGLTGSDKPVVTETRRIRPEQSEVRALVADASALSKITMWHPQFDLKSGLAETVDWWKDRIAAKRLRHGADYMV